jgi:hypothetical protein
MQCHLLMNQILRVHKLLLLTYKTQVQKTQRGITIINNNVGTDSGGSQVHT